MIMHSIVWHQPNGIAAHVGLGRSDLAHGRRDYTMAEGGEGEKKGRRPRLMVFLIGTGGIFPAWRTTRYHKRLRLKDSVDRRARPRLASATGLRIAATELKMRKGSKLPVPKMEIGETSPSFGAKLGQEKRGFRAIEEGLKRFAKQMSRALTA